MRSPPPSRILLPRNQHALAHIRQRRDLAITQANIQMLSFPFPTRCPIPRLNTLTPRPQRRKNTLHSIQPGRQIRNRNTNLHGRALPTPRQMRKAKLRFDHDVESRPVAVRACLAVACDGGVD